MCAREAGIEGIMNRSHDLNAHLRKIRIQLFCFLLILTFLCSLFAPGVQTVQAAAPLMTVTALDFGSDRVAGGESVLVSSGSSYLLMDTANNDDTNKVIRYLKSHHIQKLSLYLSHWHEDHFFYLWYIMDDPYFTVKHLYLPKTNVLKKYAGKANRSQPWYENARRCWYGIPSAGLYGAKEIIKKAKKEKIPVTYLKKGSSFTIGKARAEVLWNRGAGTRSDGFWDYLNESSLVTKITAGDMSFLTAGDVSRKTLKQIDKKQISLQADLYKLSHHGSGDSAATIRMIRPSCAFYADSSEKKGKAKRTRNRRKIAGITHLYSVRKNGNVTFRLYGKHAHTPIRVSAKS